MPRLTDEQRAWRRGGIGSSDVAAILGLSPHAGPWAVWNEKVGLALEEEEESEQMALGHELEPFLAAWYERHSGRRLVPGGSFQHPDLPWARASIDMRVMGERAAIECKNVGQFMVKGWDRAVPDGVPHHVRTQCVWQCNVAELDEVRVVAMLGGVERVVFVVRNDLELWDIMQRACSLFYHEHVLAQVPPDLDGSDEASAYLRHKYPQRDDTVIPIEDIEADADAVQYFDAHRAAKAAETTKRLATHRMITRVGEHAGVSGKGWRFTYKTSEAGRRTPNWMELKDK